MGYWGKSSHFLTPINIFHSSFIFEIQLLYKQFTKKEKKNDLLHSEGKKLSLTKSFWRPFNSTVWINKTIIYLSKYLMFHIRKKSYKFLKLVIHILFKH